MLFGDIAMLYFFVKLFIMIFLLSVYAVIVSSVDVQWPLAERKGLLSSFGEWRDGHLHAGVDFPVLKIGEEVYSVSDGYVTRLKTSPWGYGKVIYIKSWTGETYVYAHLYDFFSDLKKIVRKEQLVRKSYSVELWFKENQFIVKKGDIIAYAGRSGCFDPHLHFELRDASGSPVDPFIRGFSVEDTLPPVIRAVRLLPLDETSTVFGSHRGKVFKVVGDTLSILVEGVVGIEIETLDRVNTRSGRLGIKEIKLYKNGVLMRREFVDRFSYSNYKDSRFLFDFEYRKRTGRKFRRLFTVPGNGFPFYEGEDGIITGQDRGFYLIEVYDGSDNMSSLVIKLLNSRERNRMDSASSHSNKLMFEPNGFHVNDKWYNLRKVKEFIKSGDSIAIWNFSKKKFRTLQSPDRKCQISFNKGDQINSKLIAVKVNNGTSSFWSWEPPIPLKRKVKIKIKVPKGDAGYSIYEKNGSGWDFCSSAREGGYLVDFIDHLGVFGILKDTIAPQVSLKRKHFSSKMPLRISVQDSLSGVDFYSIQTFIDYKQTVFRYDPQKKRLIFEHPDEVSKGKHILKLSLSDRQGNQISRVWEIVKK